MGHIKFNCFELAIQIEELSNIARKMSCFSSELSSILNELEGRVKICQGIENFLIEGIDATSDMGMAVLTLHSALDQIINVYYAAESSVLKSVNKLPTGNGNAIDSANEQYGGLYLSTVSTASINSGDLLMEDWFYELVYKYGEQ